MSKSNYNTTIIRREWWDTAKQLSQEQRGMFFSAICSLAFDEADVEPSDPIVRMMITMVSSQIVADKTKLQAKLDKLDTIRARTCTDAVHLSNNNNNNNEHSQSQPTEVQLVGEEHDLWFYAHYFFMEGNSRAVTIATDYLNNYCTQKNVRRPYAQVIMDSYPKPKNPMPEVCRAWWTKLLEVMGMQEAEMLELTAVTVDSFVPTKAVMYGVPEVNKQRLMSKGGAALCAALSTAMGRNITSFDWR